MFLLWAIRLEIRHNREPKMFPFGPPYLSFSYDRCSIVILHFRATCWVERLFLGLIAYSRTALMRGDYLLYFHQKHASRMGLMIILLE